MERVLQRLDEIEERINEKIDASNDEMKQEIDGIKSQFHERSAQMLDCVQGQSVAIRADAKDPHGYKESRGMIPNPKLNRTAKESSFISVGKVLYTWIEKHNGVPESSRSGTITQIGKSSSAYARKAMSTVALFLGESNVFCPHLGSKTFQEIKTAYATNKSAFQKAYSELNKKLVRALPELELAAQGWAAYELIKAKLVNLKEDAKKASNLPGADASLNASDDIARLQSDAIHTASSTTQAWDGNYDPEEDGQYGVEKSEEYELESVKWQEEWINDNGSIEDVPIPVARAKKRNLPSRSRKRARMD